MMLLPRTMGLVLAFSMLSPPAATVARFPLRGIVTDQDGRPLESVVVKAGEGDQVFQALTSTDGTFVLPLPEGTYDVSFSHSSEYYPTRLEGVEIRVVKDAATENPEPGRLRITLSRRLRFELDLLVVGPNYVDPPPLQVDFEIRPSPPGGPLSGVVRLTNAGDTPLAVPLTQERNRPGGYSRDLLLMQVQVEVKDIGARFDQPYICRVGDDCRALKPLESVSIPIDLLTRESHDSDNPEPAARPDRGSHPGSVRVYFVLPNGGPRETFTRELQASFSVEPD